MKDESEKFESKLENCLLEIRAGETAFYVDGPDIYCCLDAYAVIPRVKYEVMLEELKRISPKWSDARRPPVTTIEVE